MKTKIQVPTGTKDLVNQELNDFNFLKEKWLHLLSRNAFNEIQTPVFEDKSLFVRSVGEFSDIVSKEMFDLGEYVLRPEGTAPIMRSYLENNLVSFERYSYFLPFFRKEKPQKGRFRQFYQYGLEIFKEKSPQAELECFLILKEFYQSLGVKYKISLNYIPSEAGLKKYEEDLLKFYNENQEKLSETAKTKIKNNSILRILDSKEDRELNKSAPKILAYLNESEQVEYSTLLQLFNQFGIDYEQDDSLVRGLDYYQGLVFEVVDTSNKLGSQNALGGGGRYNKLSLQLSDTEISAFGFAGGVERLLLQLGELSKNQKIKKVSFVSDQDILLDLFTLKKKLESGRSLYVDINYNNKIGFKKMFKRADQIKSDYVVVIGANELSSQMVKVKNMKNGDEKVVNKDYKNLEYQDIID